VAEVLLQVLSCLLASARHLDHECADAVAVRIAVRDDEARGGLLEDERHGVERGGGAEPREARPAMPDARPQ
jgi:hypothetical protein